MTADAQPRSLVRPRIAVNLREQLASEPFRELATFAVIGVASTLAYVVLFATLRRAMPAAVANGAALVLTALANTAANRRLTFGVRGRERLARHHAAGLGALAAALFITTASLAALGGLDPQAGREAELAVLVAANGAATVVRFFLLRAAVVSPAAATMSGSGLERTAR